jgi:protein involved in polysaccharide export with SLBB domain
MLLAQGAELGKTNFVANAGRANGKELALLDDQHKLGSGDRVSFRVIEDQDEPKSLTVTDAGDIEVPYYGLIRAGGKTCRTLAREVKKALESTHYHQATVIVAVELLNKTRGRVYVAGQVRNPGPQEVPVGEPYTVGKAILKAGGFTDFADKKRVRLVRKQGEGGGKRTFVINIFEVWEGGKTEKDLQVEPEDLIYIPERLVNF